MDKASHSQLGSLIRARRLAFGLNQEAIASRMVARGDTTFRQTDVSRLELGKVGLPRRERLAHLAAVLELSTDDLVDAWAGSAPTTMPRQVPQQCKPNDQQAVAQPDKPGPVAGSHDMDDALVTSSPSWRPGSTNCPNLLAESEEILFTARHLRAQSQLRLERAAPARRGNGAH